MSDKYLKKKGGGYDKKLKFRKKDWSRRSDILYVIDKTNIEDGSEQRWFFVHDPHQETIIKHLMEVHKSIKVEDAWLYKLLEEYIRYL